jgi:uncharacterized damage-inducible protein DinB
LLTELSQEAAATRRLLERVPPGELSFRPHRTSMSLGQLALHVASIPGSIIKLSQLDEFDASQISFEPSTPNSIEEILTALETSLKTAKDYIGSVNEDWAKTDWRLTVRGNEVFTMSKASLLRSLMLNHWYHHRGQLSVYLRMLEVPIPVIYGRSNDENPFA